MKIKQTENKFDVYHYEVCGTITCSFNKKLQPQLLLVEKPKIE